MLTAAYMNFHNWQMKEAYQDATVSERNGVLSGDPFDSGAIDAPVTIASGSHHAYRYQSGGWTWLPSATSRECM